MNTAVSIKKLGASSHQNPQQPENGGSSSQMDPTVYAELLKESGNQVFKNGNFSLAIRKYEEAIQILLQLCQWGVPPRDLAVLLCNKSNAFYNLGKWNEAFLAAKECLRWDSTYVKGYYRAGYSLMQLHENYEAARMFFEGLRLLRRSQEQSQIADFLVGVFTAMSNDSIVLQSFLPYFDHIFTTEFSTEVWQSVIEKLAKKELWHIGNILSLWRPHPLLCVAVVKKKKRKKEMEQVPKLVQWLISIGASIETIGPYPLHALMRLCIKASESHLFRWLMDHKPEWKGRINQKDRDGCTVLHVVAAHSPGYLIKRQTEDVQMLLRFGADPTLLDGQSRSPVDVLKRNKNFKAIEKINSHLKKLAVCSKDVSGLSNGDGPLSESDIFRNASAQLVKYMNSGNGLLYKNFLKQDVVQRFLHLLSSLQEIPADLVCDINPDCANTFIKFLLEKQKWPEVLLLLTRKVSGEPPLGDCLIKDCNFASLDLCTIIPLLSTWDQRRTQLLRCLIDRGALPEGLQNSREKPLVMCLKHEDFELAFLLLTKGADPHGMSLTEGDTPLHAALHIFLDIDADIGFNFLNYLLDLFWSNATEFHYLNPNVQDSNGNTLMHILFQRGMLKRMKKLLDLLVKFDINFNLKNKEGKDARHRVKKSDPLLLAWNKALMESRRRSRQDSAAHPGKPPRSAAPGHIAHLKSQVSSKSLTCDVTARSLPQGAMVADSCETLPDAQMIREETGAVRPCSLRDGLVQDIMVLIEKVKLNTSLPGDYPEDSEPLGTGAGTQVKKDELQRALGAECSDSSGNNLAVLEAGEEHAQAGLGASQLIPVGHRGREVSSDQADQSVEEVELCLQDFENMTWEIECASETLKKLSSKAMPKIMKKKIILAIQQLGNGEWTQGLQKRLKHLQANIRLFEAKLDKGGRMLWELAIDFSPRCSENPEKIIATERSSHFTEKSGRVYTEIIRIWDIVLDHKKLSDSIKAICNAYSRGLSCVLRKKLKGINKSQVSTNVKTRKRIPRCYVEDTEADKSQEYVEPEYFPPASAVETEYNIMKFHSFSTHMAFNILNDTTATVEYPFRVGELEYAVIDLNPRPLEPIILIGRSGTGKTTCCLYRLWKKFHVYWEKAEQAGSPLLVKQILSTRRLELEPGKESAGGEEEEEKGEDEDEEGSLEVETVDGVDEEQEGGACAGRASGELGAPGHGAEVCVPDQPRQLEHLHQIFVTKNHVLCQEVQRNFIELSKSTKATSHYKPLEPNVHKLQDLKDENFPLFVTSKQLLLLLDASMPKPFFLRNEDGSLKRTIVGWSTQEELSTPNWQEEEEEEEEAEMDGDSGEEDKVVEMRSCDIDPRVYVTFEVFTNEIWPKMNKGKTSYNPALIWKEIKSFLKGSFEALSCPQGRLTEEAYKKLGRKRAPNFKEDRSEIYSLFCLYQQIRSQKGYFDEEDILYNLSQRLSKLKVLPWSIHELYGDEIQDFTQAELALLMKCINDPNAMFLTGDTAQSIMKGVAFRFSDLRSVFHYASKNTGDKQCAVRKPKKIYQLYQNYRSHSGILNLASGVLDLLQFYFPESFDRLPRDSGLFDGPKPTVLESCSVSDLAILLRGNKRKTQPIEFGAHQVILVANEMAKEKIPEELGLALVLTVYEAKGLEFDDVLLYNFFTDSEAYKEWKIISFFTSSSSDSRGENQPLIEVPLETPSSAQGRSVVVNPEMYKLLNGELKQLYTAITRARVNLWIFDENLEKRAPAFKYFSRRNFVQVVKTDKNKDLDDSMFVKTSTPEEWIAQGEYYAKHQCWKVAAKCYQKGGAFEKEKLALAHNTALNMKSKKLSPKEKQMEYLELAKTYLECNEPKLSLKCLSYAKEFQLSGQLCEKMGKIRDAAHFYKRSHCYQHAFRCFEQIQEFDQALKIYCQEERYEEAAVAVEKYEEMLRKAKTLPISKLSYSASQFYLEAAAKYLSANKIKEMKAVLSKLDVDDQLVFLKSRKRLSDAAELLNREGRNEEAALLMKQHGRLLEAARLTADKDFQASCLLEVARLSVARDSDVERTTAILREALDLCSQTNQLSGFAEAQFRLGVILRDFQKLKDAFFKFDNLNHSAGMVEALYEATNHCKAEPEKVLVLAPGGLEALLNLVRALKKVTNNAEKDMVKSCFEFFGISQVDAKYCKIAQNISGPILRIILDLDLNLKEKKTKDHFFIMIDQVKLALNKHLLSRLCQITRSLLGKNYPGMCMRFMVGLKCEDENCEDFHRPVRHCEARCLVQSKMHLVAINGLLLEAKKVFPKTLAKELEEIDYILSTDMYHLCKSFLSVLFPKHFHQRVLSENPVACKEILKTSYRSFRSYRFALKEYIHFLFQNERARSRRESTDLWLSAMQAFVPSSSYPEEFEKLLRQEEDNYHRELKALESGKEERGSGRGSRMKGIEGRFGMLAPNKDDGSTEKTHLCFIRLLENCIDQLYVYRNPENYKRLFFRFMNVLVKRCKEPLIPSIGNTVALLESQFIHCGVVLARLRKNTILCLPKSYLALLYYWEFLFRKKNKQLGDVFCIIQEYKPKDVARAIQGFRFHLAYLAKVLCGYENMNFNVLLDAFAHIDYVVSGEAERTLVLFLVMLVNAEAILQPFCKPVLHCHLQEIDRRLQVMSMDCPDQVPERLQKVVKQVSMAVNVMAVDVKSVAEALKDLLFERDEEYLMDCCWRWDSSHPKGVRGLYYEEVKLNRLLCVDPVDYSAEPECAFDHNEMDEQDRDHLLANILSQRQRKASIQRKLRRVCLVVSLCISWRRRVSAQTECFREEARGPGTGNFKRADVDRTQCDLCGVKFTRGPENYFSPSKDFEGETSETVALSSAELDDKEGQERNSETFEQHIRLEGHQRQQMAYQKYSEFFRDMVDPAIDEGNLVVQDIEQSVWIRSHLGSKEQSHMLQRKVQENIKKVLDTVEDLYRRKAWASAEEVMTGLVNILIPSVRHAREWLKKTEVHLKEEGIVQEDDYENEVEDFGELRPRKRARKYGKQKKY
ncbi:PREDICTED: TPR and ankyrin repeat-containing protein 1 [Hipposideros armiger]|uniref:TPR and ankyrin repeat-containing protein 1 n=1 Tax=Hipposideros armiger TaxID=186990 RepID=A0A8B7RP33_HIPAR|nr:PREDICTED: TPR and ankyrin repeat-containing protein 1 [Hipposideros armiger]